MLSSVDLKLPLYILNFLSDSDIVEKPNYMA